MLEMAADWHTSTYLPTNLSTPLLTYYLTNIYTVWRTGSALAAASDIHRQIPTHMADIRRDWVTNQNTD